MSKILSTVVATCLGLVIAASASAQDRPSTGPAPTVHPGTKLSFPASLGGATLVRGDAFGPDMAYVYALPNHLQIVVLIRDVGRRMPAGSDNPQLAAQFTAELNTSEQQARANGFTKFEKPSVPSACTYGSVTFRCIVFNATGGTLRAFSKMMMTGYGGMVLEIRADWSQASQLSQADADHALQAFVPALLR